MNHLPSKSCLARLAWIACGTAMAAGALAQSAPASPPTMPVQNPTMGQPMATPGDGKPPPPQVRRAGSIEYMNGGAGEESRNVIEGMQSHFSLHNVFSGKGGEYVVAETVTVRGGSGAPTEIKNAGPLLVMALPPGKYTIEATVDGKMQSKSVTVGERPVKLNWNWPGA